MPYTPAALLGSPIWAGRYMIIRQVYDMGWQIYDNQADSRAGSRMTTCLEIPALKNWRLLALPTSGHLHPPSLCSL